MQQAGAGKSVAEWVEEGIRLLESGAVGKAETVFRRILDVDPNHAEGSFLLGTVRYLSRNNESAVELLTRAVKLRPGQGHYHNNLAGALRDLGRKEEALAQFLAAARLRPDSSEIHFNAAGLLRDFNRLAEAETHFRKALELRPDHAGSYCSLGDVYFAMGRREEARECYLAALKLNPDYPEARNNLGNVFQSFNRLEEAETSYSEALRLKPDYVEAHYNLGCALSFLNRADEATAHHERALELNPDYGAARIAACMARLPVLYERESDIAPRREDYARALGRLAEYAHAGKPSSALVEAVGTNQPFFLGYQGHDDRDLQSLYGSTVCESEPPPNSSYRSGEKIRVGIVSGFFEEHTVWRLLIGGWLRRLDRRQFEIFGYHTGHEGDSITRSASMLCDRFARGLSSGSEWRERIRSDAPHVLLFPEIGMDPLSAHLAAQRNAPVQCCSWGHPVTTGFPTMDYFLTSDLMEPQNGASHYTERLVRLPHLGMYFVPGGPLRVSVSRSDFGLPEDAFVYWSGQALYKYLPQYDEVFPRIALEVGKNCRFVFIEYARSRHVTEQFRRRLHGAFAAFGLDHADYCIFAPYMKANVFVSAIGLCDAVLDTIGWSGGLSAMDCLTHDIPLTTLAGPFMRSRHTAAILHRLGVMETVADDVEGYIAAAVRTAKDSGFREEMVRRIRENRHLLYRDEEYIGALEAFLLSAVRDAGA